MHVCPQLSGSVLVLIAPVIMGVLGMRELHAQQAYGYPRAEACISYVENEFAIDAFSAYDTEWELIVDGAYDHYRVADDPDVCFEVSAGLQNYVSARNLINGGSVHFVLAVMLLVSVSVAGKVAPKKTMAFLWCAIFGFFLSEAFVEGNILSIPTLSGFLGGTAHMMTEQQLRDPCSEIVSETDVAFFLSCRELLPITNGPENRQLIEAGAFP